VPTVGLAFGIDRLHDVMEELNLGPRAVTTAAAYVTIFNADTMAASLALANELRAAGEHTVIALDPSAGLGKQLKEADRKGVRYALVLGPDELAAGTVVIKDLRSNTQQTVERAQLAEWLRAEG
jgi:histidyl-tRNA synthetase